ncbi:universal stress protein [Methanofollis tationis]|uniref:Universal stress protein n=1 Tax=Methanofollis tationis TaxID=81417 RepID=A0A7K4HPV5_9EURY|nr:universal stress protein [Methanofollis tationis]NVO67097.1 universal stress protein [Methanofollis tationis]
MKMDSMLVPLEIHGAAAAMAPAVEEIARLGVERVELLYVINIRETAGDPGIHAHDREVMDGWKKRLETCGVPDVGAEVVAGIPWIEILERAEANPPSLIVMGSHGRSLIPRMLLGSQTENVLAHAAVPLLILRLAVMKEGDPTACTLTTDRIFRRVLYLTDFSGDAERCIPFIEWMARARPERLVIMHVQDTRRLWTASQEQISEFNRKDAARLADLKRHFEPLGIPQVVTMLVTGNAIDEILGVEETFEPTLIVMGAKGRHSAIRSLLGGVTGAVVHGARAHVLVVR